MTDTDLTDTIIPKSDQRETWRDVVGYEGTYQVSDLGRVRSLDRVNRDGHRRKGRMIQLTVHPRGYLMVNLWRANQCRMWLVHRLVLTAFVCPQPAGMESLHRNGDPGNNRLPNLAWGTHAQNQRDQVAHGTHVNAAKDECPAGHPYDDANTYTYPGRPHRGCRACRRTYMSEYRRRSAA